jgi:hypothetical protein
MYATLTPTNTCEKPKEIASMAKRMEASTEVQVDTSG